MCKQNQHFWHIIVCLYCLAIQTFSAPVDIDAELAKHEETGGYFEGDMDIQLTRNGFIAESKRWPANVVYYRIDSDFDADHIEHIMRAIEMIEQVSCVRFRRATSETVAYVSLTGEPTGCHSKVGYQGIVQNMNLQNDPLEKGCFRIGSIMHEFLHTLGFYHQQSTPNRDDYIHIASENIQEGREHNFKKYGSNVLTEFDVPYDFGSILHYNNMAFSKNGKATIVPLRPTTVQLGQRRRLSEADIDKLNIMYKCRLRI